MHRLALKDRLFHIKIKMVQEFKSKVPFPRNRIIHSAVYLIVCRGVNEVYVGSSGDVSKRMIEHRSKLRKGNHENKNLQKLYAMYGEDSFYLKFKYTNYSKYEGLLFEEKFISLYTTVNIAKEPTKGGSPNKGKKLTEEWKINLHKDKDYKHSDSVLSKVTLNNKNGGCKLLFTKDDKELNFNSWVEASKHFGVKGVHYFRGNLTKYKGWKITILTSQKKKIILEHINEKLEFNSAGECDRFLNMWKGATSHYLLRDGEICGFKVWYVK